MTEAESNKLFWKSDFGKIMGFAVHEQGSGMSLGTTMRSTILLELQKSVPNLKEIKRCIEVQERAFNKLREAHDYAYTELKKWYLEHEHSRTTME